MHAGQALIAAFGLVWAATGFSFWRGRAEIRRRWRSLRPRLLDHDASGVSRGGRHALLHAGSAALRAGSGRFAECPEIGDEDTGKDFETIDTRMGAEQVRAYVQTRPEARGWMIWPFHGNAESACSAVYYARQLADLPLDFAVIEYPGYLADVGSPPSSQDAFQRGAEAAFSYVESVTRKICRDLSDGLWAREWRPIWPPCAPCVGWC